MKNVTFHEDAAAELNDTAQYYEEKAPGLCFSFLDAIEEAVKKVLENPAGITAFFTGHILADLTWYGAVSLAMARGRMFLTPRVYRAITAAGAAFLALFACWFVYSGLVRITVP